MSRTAPVRGLRQSMDWLHGWVGIVFGWLIFAIALTGTASVFKGEIGDWMRPEVTAPADPDAALITGLRWLATHAGRALAWYVTAPDTRTATPFAMLQPDPAGDYVSWALDPASGSPHGIRDTLGGEFFYRFHFELELPYPWGRYLASLAGMALLVAILSGIVTHRRIFADFFTLRSGKGKRSWLDAHNLLGVLPLPFHLMISLTGVLMLITLTLPWSTMLAYRHDPAAADAELFPGVIVRERANRPAPLADPAAMVVEARRRFGGAPIGRITVENPGDAAAVVTVWQHDAAQIAYNEAWITFDGSSGRTIGFHAEQRPAMSTYNVLYGLHMGRFGDTVTRWLYFLCGLALSATIATGLLLWSVGRADIRDWPHGAVARLTVGAIAGLMLAAAGFLWANRLLPATIEARPIWEVRAFFLLWAAALMHGVVRPPRAGWREALGANALAWGLLPLVSALTVGRGLLAGAAAGDGLFVVADLVFLALAALSAAAAWRMTRPATARPARRAAA